MPLGIALVPLQNFFRESMGSPGTEAVSVSVVSDQIRSSLFMPDLSCLKWGDDGELSPNDTLNLLEKLTKAQQESKEAGGAILNSSAIFHGEPSEEP